MARGRKYGSVACLVLSGIFLGPTDAPAEWFDIGSGQAITIVCKADSLSTIDFPAYPFGEFWPPGTLTFADLVKESLDGAAAAYTATFDDAGCGCGGYPEKPISYVFHYDNASPGSPEDSLVLYTGFPDGGMWEVVGEALQDTSTNTFALTIEGGYILGNRNYAIALSPPSASTPPDEDRAASWGKIKSLFRDE